MEPEARLYFSHPKVGELKVRTGMNSVSWGYDLNVANFPTYGGEVIQILSVFIDDLTIEGDVATYPELESIYKYFSSYMIDASQGNTGKGSYNQEFMTMTYPNRGWTFMIQPLATPGFIYSRETVVPKWKMVAHVVDEEKGNYQTLKEMTEIEVLNKEPFALQGIISMAAADPANNPFSAPGQYKENKFSSITQAETEAGAHKMADYYNTLLPAYLHGDYSSLEGDIAQPAFGHSLAEEAGGTGEEHINNAQKESEAATKNGQN